MNKKKSQSKKQVSESDEIIASIIPMLEENTKPEKKKKKKSAETKEHYVNGREFEDAIKDYYKTGTITHYLGDSLRKIASGLSYAPNFINYSYKEDMVGDAVLKMFQALKLKKFKLDQGFSPFSYFTTIAFHAFISRIKKEKKHHQAIEDYKERQYVNLINAEDDMNCHRVYTRPVSYDNDSFNTDRFYK